MNQNNLEVKLSDNLKGVISEILGSCPDETAVVDKDFSEFYDLFKNKISADDRELLEPRLKEFMSTQYIIDESKYIYEDIEEYVSLYLMSKRWETNTLSVKDSNQKIDEQIDAFNKTIKFLENIPKDPTGFLISKNMIKEERLSVLVLDEIIPIIKAVVRSAESAKAQSKKEKARNRPKEIAKEEFIKNLEDLYDDFTSNTGLSIHTKQMKCEFIRVVAEEFSVKIPSSDSALRKHLKPKAKL